MIKNQILLAVIPARSGSKRLPRKNVLSFGGRLFLNWSLEAGHNNKCINSVLVNSDCEILLLAQKLGAQVIQRPVQLAQDNFTSFDAAKHAPINSNQHNYFVLLQRISPRRTSVTKSVRPLSRSGIDV